ncbi:protein of unknown function [Candidatus Methylacidiphilum fumarolicum]|uniref:Uncharacterized protein n=1 Tax=Candidatus Methylacidiphilum fumarolicum TaxID=591154 RepID=A0ABM9IFB5_9BACT|nr:protein of unknown function [Candidatus Methylacidiphilum fumarolicum]
MLKSTTRKGVYALAMFVKNTKKNENFYKKSVDQSIKLNVSKYLL